MDFFSILTLLGGLGFFLYGMHTMSTALESLAGGKLESVLNQMTSNPFKSLLLGAGITVAIQSSSALTVMLVGLVNSGIMTIDQTVGVIMGSNIGTTLTAWLLSLVGLETENGLLKFLKPENCSLLLVFAGILLIMMSKKQKRRDIGTILVGFAVLMYGMKMMSAAVSPLAESPAFASLLTAFRNPLLGVLVGAAFTGIIQSSAASVGILQALALSSEITYAMAIPVIMGQNIGTCVTALLSSIGASKNAKKVSVIHISFNIIGTVVFMSAFYGLNAVFRFAIADAPIGALGIAVVHSVFNIATTILLLPFSKQLVKLANLVLKEDSFNRETLLDRNLLATPAVAVSVSDSLCGKMAVLTRDTVLDALELIERCDTTLGDRILTQEETIDRYEDELGTFLVQLSGEKLSEADSRTESKILHAIGDLERMGDHAVNILEAAEELCRKNLTFSPAARKEVGVLAAALREVLAITLEAYLHMDVEKAKTVEPLEETIDHLTRTVRDHHIHRLQQGECSIEQGFILSDVLISFERISDHCSNLAAMVIELSHDAFDTHQYIIDLQKNSVAYARLCAAYEKKYSL